ncbi:hypothetical protein ACFFHM_11325 [Halalkalibacter kiskunsagensis]|uniref:Capsular polysaccharide biosynthesis protein n=1 Tax=Halalkalibacter kiskunsagensis TaxID=1548599 RepID=A0ABV6KDL5_9BACI
MKKRAQKILGDKNYSRLARFYKSSKPKIDTDKPVAFLFGFSKWKRPHTELYLSEYEVKFIEDRAKLSDIFTEVERYKNKVFMVWGYKEKPQIHNYALNNKIPFHRIEDGFIRSVQLGASHSVPLSMCIDSKALYYDATEPSDLEDLLNNYDFSSNQELVQRASGCITKLKDLAISKYNNVENKNVEKLYGEKKKKRVLVIGQVEDDQSIKRGCSKKMTNNELVWIAKLENPDAQIIYKPHPDVLFGKRELQSNPEEVKHIANVITEPLSLTDALETIDHVYTITSLAGFEALIRGIKVTTMGAPFYSNWGLTDDRQKVDRRQRTLTVEEVFAAAYILYPKYLHPFTKQEISIEEAMETLRVLKEIDLAKSKNTGRKKAALLIGFPDNQPLLQAYFKDYVTVQVGRKEALRDFKPKLRDHSNYDMTAFVWGYNIKELLLDEVKQQGIEIVRVGTGFLNDHYHTDIPFSLSFDKQNLPSVATGDSDLIDLLNGYDFSMKKDELTRAKQVIALLKSRDNVKELHSIKHVPTPGKKKVLVLGQPEANVVNNGISNVDLVWVAKTENPQADVIFKAACADSGLATEGVYEIADIVTGTEKLHEILREIDHVYTIDSNGAMEAIIRDIPVTTLGSPFYAGWGLTDDRKTFRNRRKTLTVEELIAVSYVVYPKYMNPYVKDDMTAEDAIKLMNVVEEITKTKKDVKKAVPSHLIYQNEAAATQEAAEKNMKQQGNQKEFEVKGEDGSEIGVLSKGIQIIPNLDSFVKGRFEFDPRSNVKNLDFIAGWGYKPSAEKALKFAKEHNLPYLALEDGFLRSRGLGVDGDPPLSVCVDDVGVYYDATKPSRLENILNKDTWITSEIIETAKEAMSLIADNYLSKYNHAPMIDETIFKKNNRKRVLIVDQTYGDMSIQLGLANADDFMKMYESAIKEHPDADFYIKTHPDVISGKKQGNITDLKLNKNTTLISTDCNPISLIEQVDVVYVVTSQFGFEALMLGKEVHCFGMPFYAGWGVTNDRKQVGRRKKNRTIEEIFAAAYLIYPRYINPESGKPGTIFDVIDYLIEGKSQPLNKQNRVK